MDTNAMKKSASAATANTAIVKKQNAPVAPSVMVGNMINKYKADIAQALPSVITPERFTRIATNAVANNPKMIQAVTESPRTFIGALMTCAQLGIEPNTPLGQGYLLPFNNYNKLTKKKEMQTTFQIGYQGVIDLCYRSGEVTMIQAHEVYEKDFFEYELGLDPKLKHIPYRGIDHGDVIYFYAMFKTKTGATGFACMSTEEIVEHAKRFSKSFDHTTGRFFGPWETDFIAMAKKTVLLQALKYAPKKSDFARAIVSDNSVKSELAKDMSEVQNEVIEVDVTEHEDASAAEENKASEAENSVDEKTSATKQGELL